MILPLARAGKGGFRRPARASCCAMLYTDAHRALMETTHRFVAAEINPFVDAWEEAEQLPSRELFRRQPRPRRFVISIQG